MSTLGQALAGAGMAASVSSSVKWEQQRAFPHKERRYGCDVPGTIRRQAAWTPAFSHLGKARSSFPEQDGNQPVSGQKAIQGGQRTGFCCLPPGFLGCQREYHVPRAQPLKAKWKQGLVASNLHHFEKEGEKKSIFVTFGFRTHPVPLNP